MIVIMINIQKEVAVKIGRGLLQERLIACYNLIPVESAFWWKGKIESYGETLMFLKTKDKNFAKISSYIKKHSDYDVPEVIALKPKQVNQPYLDWVNTEVK